MSRYAKSNVVLNGVDISVHVNSDLLSLTYTDNEEDEADDLQIKVLDRDGKWLTKWLDSIVSSAAIGGDIINEKPVDSTSVLSTSDSSGGGYSANSYKVTASRGVVVRSSGSTKGKKLGKLTCGTIVNVQRFSDGWALIDYNGGSGWIKSKNLVLVGSSGSDYSENSNTYTARKTVRANSNVYSVVGESNGGNWNIGDEVIVNGRPQYDSWGIGTPGMNFTDYKGKVSHLNLKSGVPYPICVDYLGWFAENQVRKVNGGNTQSVQEPTSLGLKIQAQIISHGRKGENSVETLDCGEFELDSVVADGPPQTVTIKATSLPYSNSIRQSNKSKSWENVKLSEIAGTIANSAGMGVMFESHYNPSYDRVEQYRKSDIAFLSKLCKDAGASLKITNNVIVIFDQSEYENKKAVAKFKFKDGSYINYRLSTGTNSTFTSCHVSWTDSSGTVISATEYAENYSDKNGGESRCLEVRQKVSSIAEAQMLAHKMLRLYNKYTYTAEFTIIGNTNYAAGQVVTLEGFGAWNGKFIIEQAVHTLNSSGYRTKLALRKSMPQDNYTSSQSTGAVDSDSEINELALEVIRGDWSNGQERYDKLTAAGHDYDKIQARVNEILYGGG